MPLTALARLLRPAPELSARGHVASWLAQVAAVRHMTYTALLAHIDAQLARHPVLPTENRYGRDRAPAVAAARHEVNALQATEAK